MFRHVFHPQPSQSGINLNLFTFHFSLEQQDSLSQRPEPYTDGRGEASIMTALFNFQSLLLCILLSICTCAYLHSVFPAIMDRNKDGALGIFWKLARIGERLSPYVAICCVFMAGSVFVGQ